MLSVTECVRCTKIIVKTEIHYFLGGYYCPACMNTIENDSDYQKTLLAISHLRQIEN